MIWVEVRVPVTALITPSNRFTTPPTRFNTGQRGIPSKLMEQLVDVCELYWMMTLYCAEGLLNNGSRSGEILELSAKADPTVSRTSQRIAPRAILVEH